ncbi:hypothetical protein CB1_000118016 [Camelus ferus]|nr:hypothetical protein CB1_000118016 [Camelus ferus]
MEPEKLSPGHQGLETRGGQGGIRGRSEHWPKGDEGPCSHYHTLPHVPHFSLTLPPQSLSEMVTSVRTLPSHSAALQQSWTSSEALDREDRDRLSLDGVGSGSRALVRPDS